MPTLKNKAMEADELLWRYMPTRFFLGFLLQSALPLIPVHMLSDKSEGRPRGVIGEFHKMLSDVVSKIVQDEVDKAYEDAELSKLLPPFCAEAVFARPRIHSYVSAWCRSDVEQNHMWFTYGDPAGSIAVVYRKSVIQKAIDDFTLQHFADSGFQQWGRIVYLREDDWDDHEFLGRLYDSLESKGTGMGREDLFLKSNIFEGDREYRFVVVDGRISMEESSIEANPEVLFFPIDCSSAEKIVVGPSGTDNFAEMIQKLCNKLGCNASIERSYRDLLVVPKQEVPSV